jgi:hypothetical protein
MTYLSSSEADIHKAGRSLFFFDHQARDKESLMYF